MSDNGIRAICLAAICIAIAFAGSPGAAATVAVVILGYLIVL